MTMNGPRLRSLLRQAERAKDAGKLAVAQQSYREILAEAPESPEAWLGLGDVLTDPQEKEQAYEKVLALAADNQGAQIGLAKLRGEPVPEFAAEQWNRHPLSQSPVKLAVAAAPKPAAAAAAPQKPVPEKVVPPTSTAAEEEAFELFCYRHPTRSTSLRCYSCNRPICSDCTNKTPVGYICSECKYKAEEKFFSASKLDYVIAGVISFILSLIAGVIVVRLGTGFFLVLLVFFVGGAVGGFIGKLTNRIIGGRRGRYIPHIVAAMVILGVVIPALPIMLASIAFGSLGGLLNLLVPGIYAFVASSSAFYWMR